VIYSLLTSTDNSSCWGKACGLSVEWV